MKILFYGAGVIGQTYAAMLLKSGVNTTLLARGENYRNLIGNGVTINNALTNEKINVKVPVIQNLIDSDPYDLIAVTVRLDQLENVKENLKRNSNCKTILFMLNHPEAFKTLEKDFPDKKIILGFPGIGGTHQGNQISFVQIKKQKTTLGDYSGILSGVTKELKNIFEKAGFDVRLEKEMKAWLIIHSVFISTASAAIALEDGNSIKLGKNSKKVRAMVQGIREGFKACQELGLPIIPKNLKTIFLTMPKWFSVLYWSIAMNGKTGTLAIAPHANSAKNEMQLLSKQVLKFVENSTIETPTLKRLLTEYIDLK